PREGFRKDKPDFRKDKPDFRKDNSDFRKDKPDFRKDKPDFRKDKPDFRKDKPDFRKDKPNFRKEKVDYRREANLQPEEEMVDDKLEGRNSVLEALKAGRTINKIFVSKGDREGSVRQIVALAKEKKIIVSEVDRIKLDNMSTTYSHQGVIAFVAAKDYVEVDDILAIAEQKGEAPFIIILDEITDPQNLGSILRTADSVGAHGVIIPRRRAIGLTAVVSKASAGAVEHVAVSRVTNIAQTIDYLKKKNIWVAAADVSGNKAFYEADLSGPIALVIGSEGEGIGKLILEKCDFIVNIPMKGKISSLNAAVAGAVMMYEILKQRIKK
ncbi:MAG: rRNA methylase, putative, group 3, partial [Clostridiales bacterium]|nr:rRNA methylase, putative, group 3 [Clostridiales bacterium]